MIAILRAVWVLLKVRKRTFFIRYICSIKQRWMCMLLSISGKLYCLYIVASLMLSLCEIFHTSLHTWCFSCVKIYHGAPTNSHHCICALERVARRSEHHRAQHATQSIGSTNYHLMKKWNKAKFKPIRKNTVISMLDMVDLTTEDSYCTHRQECLITWVQWVNSFDFVDSWLM